MVKREAGCNYANCWREAKGGWSFPRDWDLVTFNSPRRPRVALMGVYQRRVLVSPLAWIVKQRGQTAK